MSDWKNEFDIEDDEIRFISKRSRGDLTPEQSHKIEISYNSNSLMSFLSEENGKNNLSSSSPECCSESNQSSEEFDQNEPVLHESSCSSNSSSKSRSIYIVFGISQILVITLLLLFLFKINKKDIKESREESIELIGEKTGEENVNLSAFSTINDLNVGDFEFLIITPENAVPALERGEAIMDDSLLVLIAEAAGINDEKGEILGSCVLNGDLVSSGQSKAGYCAIIDGEMNIGVSLSTSLLEQAIESKGYFFRQLPLVVANQPIDNDVQTIDYRKALALLNDKISVILSKDKMTLNQFSRALSELGVAEAISLEGSTSYGFAVEKDGEKFEFGERIENPSANVNYIYWKSRN